ncbi:MAG: sulfotransferase, partial [Gammaproteobacteria bacterium]
GQTHDENALNNFGNALVLTGSYNEAREIFLRALKLNSNCYRAVKGLANVYNRQGDYEKAYEVLKPFIAADDVDPGIALAFATICHGVDLCDEAIAMMEKILDKRQNSLDKTREMYLCFRLGKLYDRKQVYDRAFSYYLRANSLKDAVFNMDEFSAYLDQLRHIYDKSLMQSAPHACNEEAGRLIFIVGMPRSGTTLVEQILAAHPQVNAGGELPYMNDITAGSLLQQKTDSRQPYPLCVVNLDQVNADQLAGYYIDQIRHLLCDNHYVTDKFPHNFLNLGLIKLLFPEARIIHCMRNAMDTCLSCFFQEFRKGHYYAYDLETLAAYYREYQKLMSHWKEQLNIEMLDMPYEELVRDQEKYSHMLLDFCGLPWDERCMLFFRSKRHISTISYDQVRQPIYTSSVARWKHYEPYIDSLVQALGSDTD